MKRVHHPSCHVRQFARQYQLPVNLVESVEDPCQCPRKRRTLAGDLERLRFAVVSLLWRLARSERFVLVLAAVAIAGVCAGLLWGWFL